MNAKRG
jgi:hypothetical protein